MALARGSLTTTPTAVYTSTGQSAITNVYFCNTTSGPINLDVYLVTSGGLADVTNIIYQQVGIPAFDTFVMDTEKIVFDDGDAIYATASNSPAIVATVSYMRI